jgi:hypothetical protein
MVANGFRHLSRGEWIIHARNESGVRPPPDAVGLRPATKGDTSCWTVEEWGVVLECRPDGLVLVRMAGGDHRLLPSGDPRLRRVGLLQRLRALRMRRSLRVS